MTQLQQNNIPIGGDPLSVHEGCQATESMRRRLLLIVPSLVMGGADKFNLNLVQQLVLRGWQITLVCTEETRHHWYDEFARHTSDIILLHQKEVGAYPEALKALINSRRPDVVLISNSEPAYLLLPYLRSCCPEPVFLDYCHSEELHWRDGGFPALSVQLRDHLDATLVASLHLKKWMEERGRDSGQIFVRYINVDTEQWLPDPARRREVREACDIDEQAVVILFPARLSPEKQPMLFAKVVKVLVSRYGSLVAVVAGDGELRGELTDFLHHRHGLSQRVKFLGNVPIEKMPALMAASDILFLPSRYEGISQAIYEAMACGLVVVAADVGGQRELVGKETGVLVRGKTEQVLIEGYVEALASLIEDQVVRLRMGAAARELVIRKFTLQAMARGFEDIYTTVLQNRGNNDHLDAACAERHARQAVEYLRAFGKNPSSLAGVQLPWKVKVYALATRVMKPLYFWCVDRRWRWVVALKNGLRKRMGIDDL